MPHSVELQERARIDLLHIYSYIAEHNAIAAQRVFDDLRRETASLADTPFMGSPLDDLGPGLRQLVVGSYLAFYRVDGDRVEVLRYLHGARHLPDYP